MSLKYTLFVGAAGVGLTCCALVSSVRHRLAALCAAARHRGGRGSGALAAVVASLVLAVPAVAQWVATDRSDYYPGQTVYITGGEFMPGETVTLLIVHDDGTIGGGGHVPFDAVCDAQGGFSATWYVDPDDSAGATLILTADGQTSGLHAETVFTDNVSVDFRQSANNDAGYGLGNIHWLNS